ncbi:MAG TPA: nitroreductase/quinone reductase family protein [Mycobacteriales bacterium]|nr:nitroreductase/quinone reductase family protein [Mycobacteriales bacterium]
MTFPDARWGSERSWLRRPLVAFASTHLGSWLIRTLTPLDRRLLVRSRGRYTVLGPTGSPVLLLTTTGATSGLPRTTPLAFARDGDRVIVVGSNFGQDHHPAWTGNLIKTPSAVVTIGGKDIPVTAELLEGPAAEEGYRRMVEMARTYGAYRGRTDRAIRVFRLSGTT